MPFIWMILDVLFESFGLKRWGVVAGMARRSLKRRQLEIFEEKLTHDLYGPTNRDPGLI